MPVRWDEQQILQINIGFIRTVRDFLPFLCNSIFLVQYNLISNIRVCVFIRDLFQDHNILATRNSNDKRDITNKEKGVIAQHIGEDTSKQQRDTQRIYNKVPAYNEPNKSFIKQLQGIRLYVQRRVLDCGCLNINIYIVIHRQTVSFYQNSSVWLDTQDARSRDRNPSNFTLDCASHHSYHVG